jgi:ankyrin repeat protein
MADTLAPHSAILAALYARKPEEVDALLARQPDLSIFEAAALGRDDRVRELLASDPTLAKAWAADGHTALGLASFFGHATTAVLLLHQGAEIGAAARNPMNVQPLHAAVAARSVPVAMLLLDAGADPNARQQAGYTPLMGAASAGHAPLVTLLLDAGADPALRSDDGSTAADVARSHGHAELANALSGR